MTYTISPMKNVPGYWDAVDAIQNACEELRAIRQKAIDRTGNPLTKTSQRGNACASLTVIDDARKDTCLMRVLRRSKAHR